VIGAEQNAHDEKIALRAARSNFVWTGAITAV
jgi:hypothetical protein